MYANNGTPKLPSGQQMTQLQLPHVVQEQVQTIALQVLQRLFTPLLRRYRLRKTRALLHQQYLSQHSTPGEVAVAAECALQHVSFLGAVTRDLYTTTSTHTTATANAAANNNNSSDSNANTSPAASREGLSQSYPTSPTPAPTAPAPDFSAASAAARERVRAVVNSRLVHLCIFLQDEMVQWEWEPASEVLVLLAGAVDRRGSAVSVARAAAAAPFGGSAGGGSLQGSRRTSALPAHAGSRVGSLSFGRSGGSRRGSASLQPPVNLAATTTSGMRRTSSSGLSDGPFAATGVAGRPHTSSPATYGGNGGRGYNDVDAQLLAAPQVLGELACLGAFPYCASLCVTSPTAVFLRIPKEVYCTLVRECVPPEGQRRLLVEALQLRERLMPYYAPLTPARLLLCPLLLHLRAEQLEHIRDLAIPRVYAAGMECGEKESPRHIFFIRRGVVHMQREGGAGVGSGANSGGGGGGGGGPLGAVLQAGSGTASEYSSQQAASAISRASYSLELPKNRPVLVEGHTYGETGCIFGDALGDRYTAVTHVDMYLLPFQVLIQLMKQVPEVQSTVYRSAQELSFLRDKEWPGVLFGPRLFGAELPGVHGLVPAQGLLASMAAAPATQAADWHTTGSRVKRGSGGAGLDPLSRPGGGNNSGTATRRVTIFEDALTVAGTADRSGGTAEGHPGGGLAGGRVSTALLTAMEQLPVVSLLPSFDIDFSRACTQQWQCVTYTKGEVIAPAGQECNRLLLFFEGRAGVVHNAALFREEMQAGPFGAPDISSVGADAVCPIPAGHVVGYTCVRRHRWTHTIVALDDVVEVWEMRRHNFVQLLRTHGMEREMQTAALQLLQPLATQKERLAVLDYQPLLHPMPNSLWTQQAVPNLHPVVTTKEGTACFPVWREGDFPLDRRASVADSSARLGSGGGSGRRSTLTAVGSVKVAAIANERQRSAGQRVSDSPKRANRQPSTATALSDSDNAARTNFIARLTSAA